MNNHRRTVRLSPAVLENAEEQERYAAWVADPSTQRYLQLAHDYHIAPPLSIGTALAAQEALALVKRQEGAMAVINFLLNLDEPELRSVASGEVAETWGTEN